jgi:cytidylate kinase
MRWIANMQPYHPLERLVGGVAGAQHHWQTRRREAAASPVPAFTITVERETGTSGTNVAQEVGRRLGWQVYDHELLERIAVEHGLRVSLLESLDERRQSWLVECMEGFSQRAHIGETGYVHHLTQTLLSLGAHGECVIVGRGAGLLLPPATTLRVRLMAPAADRVAVVMRQRGLSKHDAERWLETTDRERIAFLKDHFQKDPTDSRRYDLLLNTSRWSVMECADLILDAFGRLGSRAAVAGSYNVAAS